LDDSPETHIRLLDQFLAVVPHILPPEIISFPVLWHTDLHAGNIMIKPEGIPDAVAIIDWQGMGVAPLFMQSVFPKFARYTGDDRIVLSPGLKIPTLPPDFAQYSEDEQTYIRGQLRLGIFTSATRFQ
jgi:aminoglycoside phosphotransferase (APT) family kinase protein